MKANCSGQDGTARRSYGVPEERLADAPRWPFLKFNAALHRYNGPGCYVRRSALNEAFIEWATKQNQVWEVWPQILNRVDSDGEVKVRKQEIAKCMLERGYDEFDVAAALPWQISEKPDEEKPVKRYATTEEERAAMRARYADLNECALKSGIYDVQEALWFAEVQRLEQQDPCQC